MAGRFFYEDRWGGEMQWEKNLGGGTEVYGKHFILNVGIIGHELPLSKNAVLVFLYRPTKIQFMAICPIWQNSAWLWSIDLGLNKRFGTALGYQYDDNTCHCRRRYQLIPSLFVQDEN
jgi:outer membrane receptor for ferrienterochelin and colicins